METRLRLLFLCAGLICLQSGAEAGNPFQFVDTGHLNLSRTEHTAALLPDGTVLVAGGIEGGGAGVSASRSAELYDPTSGSWTSTGNMSGGRYGHTATLLTDATVLVAGGLNPKQRPSQLTSAELYDPASGMWTTTASLAVGRTFHTATRLVDGRVLVAGGSWLGSATDSVEIYDPASGSWTEAASLLTARGSHTAVLLRDGKVLVAGGSGPLKSAEIYDPANNTWAPTGSMINERLGHTATLLPGGEVLVAGGAVDFYTFLSSAEIYDPASGNWRSTGSLALARRAHTATLLANSKVLVVAGDAKTPAGGTAEIYDPARGAWTLLGATFRPVRDFHTTTLLADGLVLVAGGHSGGTGVSSSVLGGRGILPPSGK